MPRIRVLNVKWDLMSTVIMTRFMRALNDVEDMAFRERYEDRVQVVAWPDSVVFCSTFICFVVNSDIFIISSRHFPP